MKLTDLFIRRPVIAIVVNLVIVIAGLQAIRSLNARQYPRSENAQIVVTTAYVGANADLVRGDLPPEAEVPVITVESADSALASAYLSFSSEVLKQNEITDYLVRVVQPRLSAIAGVQRADILGARTFAMRVWLKPDRM